MIRKNFPENVEIVKAVNGREAIKLYQERQCQIQKKELFCISTLDAYLDLLELWKKQYARSLRRM